DGLKDIATLSEDNSTRTIWSGPRSESAAGEEDVRIDTIDLDIPNGQAISLAETDIDTDGRVDLIVGADNDAVVLIKNGGNRRFSRGDTTERVYASSIAAADLDEDGHVDLITSKATMRRAAGEEMVGGAKLANDGVTI